MYRHLVAKGCRTSPTIFRWKINLLVFAIFTILGFVKSSMAMPSREYGSIERVSVARMTYRNDREPVHEYEDEDESVSSRFPENRAGRGEARSRVGGRGQYVGYIDFNDTSSDNPSFGHRHQTEIEQRNNFIAVPESSCVGRTFCEDTISPYPEEYIRNLIGLTSSLNLLANDDSVDVDSRFNPSDGEIVCDSETKVVFPRSAQTKNEEWLFVVQDPENGFKQGVRVENCNVGMANGTCQIVGIQVPGYESSCKQKYVSRVLAAIGKNGTAMMEKFAIPSSCCCEIKVKTTSRFGIGLRSDQSPAPPRRSGRRHQIPK